MFKGNFVKVIYLFLFSVLFHTVETNAQFYDGHKMAFGKNRVQYNSFYWTYQRYEKFDTYFNEYGVQLARHAAKYAEKAIPELESAFDYSLDGRIIFIVYNKLTDFRQSNIGLVSGSTESNTGGVITLSRNKIFLYFEGDYEKFEEQIREGIAKVFVNQMFFGSNLRTNATNSAIINLPEWYIDGLTAYMSDSWDIEQENVLHDNIISGKFKKFNRLSGHEAEIAGHSFWRYIGSTYGQSVIPNIIYMTKVQKNINTGFLYTLGFKLKDLSKDWYKQLLESYTEFESETEDVEGEPILKRPRNERVYQQLKVSPTGNYVAYTTNHEGKFKVWLKNTQTGKRKKIFTSGHKLEQIVDYSYPVMAWHPSGRYLIFFVEEKGGISMYYFTFGERKLTRRFFMGFEKVLDFSFSKDGAYLAFSGVKEGQSDIYIHNIAASSNFQVTDDKAEDLSPQFLDDSYQVIFSSNRISDSLDVAAGTDKRSPVYDLFIYDYSKPSKKLRRFSASGLSSKLDPFKVGNNQYVSLQDNNGILNRYYSKFDSTISYIDTAIHYKYYATTAPMTNYNRNIREQDYHPSSKLMGEIVYLDNRYYMYLRPFDSELKSYSELPRGLFAQELDTKNKIQDSLNKIQLEMVPLDSMESNMLIHKKDTLTFPAQPIDINNYVFEQEKIGFYNDELKKNRSKIRVVKEVESAAPKLKIYNEVFYQNTIVSQVDFGFLTESYQAFSGDGLYYNPGINLALKLGVQDLFENYKITGGMSLPFSFSSAEYLISVENLKHRLDYQFVYHRHRYTNSYTEDDSEVEYKTITNEGFLVMRYPFSQVFAWATTVGLRDDNIFLVFDNREPLNVLNADPTHDFWGTLKTEFIFDNTRSLGVNLHEGTKWKIFGECYQQINSPNSNMFVVGVDFRNYLVIHRNFIFANRFAYSSSMGNSKLLYYLGGVDEWINVTPNTPTFIPLSEIRIDEDANYAYQAIATNMRGFSQNIRNGNNFAVLNSELRFPVISYFLNYPLSNAFLENLQVIGFFDVGSAWSGPWPWDSDNAYNTDIITNQGDDETGYVIEIDAHRDPIVAGYGVGVRSQLFGYFIRLDWAWGIENQVVLPHVFYLSLSLDF